MRIYINNFNIDLLDYLINQLSEQYINSEIYSQIYAIDGIYQINDKIINKIICVDNDIQIYENYYKNFTIIVDPSYYKLETANAINPQHISTKIKRCFFKLNKSSNIQLVIEGIILDDSIDRNKINDYNINPNDIYFELLNVIDINNALVKKEIIGFLSLLNNIII
jgi:hypothetical protein